MQKGRDQEAVLQPMGTWPDFGPTALSSYPPPRKIKTNALSFTIHRTFTTATLVLPSACNAPWILRRMFGVSVEFKSWQRHEISVVRASLYAIHKRQQSQHVLPKKKKKLHRQKALPILPHNLKKPSLLCTCLLVPTPLQSLHGSLPQKFVKKL